VSAEATGWVFRCSPYRGATFTIHLAIADSVNDQNGYEFWMRQSVLARKARTTRGTVNTAIEQMVNDGLLVVVTIGSGGANRYRMAMPASTEIVYDTTPGVRAETTPTGARSGDKGARPADTGVRAGQTGGARPARTEPKGTQDPTQGEPQPLALVVADGTQAWTFDAFWAAYPRRVARAAAEKAWKAALNHAAPSLIVDGAKRYATEVADRSPDKIAHPASWLNGRRWEDPPGANASGRTPARGATAPVSADRTRPAGRVKM
jgi:hypothetical protein